MGSNGYNGTSAWTGPTTALQGMRSRYLQQVVNTPPVIYTPNLPELNANARDYSEINAENSRDLERRLTPDIAATRDSLSGQIRNDLEGGGQLPAALQEAAVKAGLAGSLASGVGPGSSMGQAQITNVLGKDVINFRNQNQAKAAALLDANPQPAAGLDPGSLTSLKIGADQGRANVLNAKQAQDFNLQGQNISDINQEMQMQRAIASQQASENARLRAARQGQILGALTSVASSAAGLGGAAMTGGATTAIGGGIGALRSLRPTAYNDRNSGWVNLQ